MAMEQQPFPNAPRLLGELLPKLSPEVAAVPVAGLSLDSRQIGPGEVFLAVNGYVNDGRAYIENAIARGAVAVIADAPIESDRYSLPVVEVENLNLKLSEIAGNFYRHPSRALRLIGVTGTNGKTSCAWTIAQLLEQLAEPCGLIGTLGNGRIGNMRTDSVNTTPNAVVIQSLLRDWVDGGARWAAMEVSSHGIAQSRVAALEFDAAIFTNLSQDHLDFHGTMEAYGAEKAKLFDWPGLALAVINRDDFFGRNLLAKSRAKRVLDYSLSDPRAAVFVDQIHCDINGSRARLKSEFGEVQLQSQLLGSFNLANLVASCAALLGMGVAPGDLENAVPNLSPVPGRMECLRGANNRLFVVDYAHTPDALEKALSTLRPLTSGALHCVFGCGGDRDTGKRALMGEVASRLADEVIVTSDNPRSEAPQAIIDDICRGLSGEYRIEVNRAKAIELAVRQAAPGDVVLVAGKGHESYQEVEGRRYPFSDMACLQEALATQEGQS
ncbi:UDP-N-acetylmuramoyl-L-alanyl-D-glutamate--2,6-diaminopimelate ligase [Spongiibacter taiwanensis]